MHDKAEVWRGKVPKGVGREMRVTALIVTSVIVSFLIMQYSSASGWATMIYYLGDDSQDYSYIWNKQVLTVRVIERDEVTDFEKQLVIDAVNVWRWKLGEEFKINLDKGEYSAWVLGKYSNDINLVLYYTLGTNQLGVALPSHRDGYLEKCDISIAVRYTENIKNITWKTYFTTLMHELGHCWGLGHTVDENGDDPVDLMVTDTQYSKQGFKWIKIKLDSIQYPSELDVEAIKFVYQENGFAPPNISEVPVLYAMSKVHDVYIDPEASYSAFGTEVGYNPDVIKIKRGDSVVWWNEDYSGKYCTVSGKVCGRHTVTSGDIDDDYYGTLFNSKIIRPGESFVWTFEEKGRYPYLCLFHSWMVGVVIVE